MGVLDYLYTYCSQHNIIACFGPKQYDTLLLDKNNLAIGQLILCADLRVEDNLDGALFTGTLVLLRKNEEETKSSLDESFEQKYERRLLYLEGQLKTIITEMECSLDGEVLSATYQHVINQYDLNCDGVQLTFDFKTFIELQSEPIFNVYQELLERISILEQQVKDLQS